MVVDRCACGRWSGSVKGEKEGEREEREDVLALVGEVSYISRPVKEAKRCQRSPITQTQMVLPTVLSTRDHTSSSATFMIGYIWYGVDPESFLWCTARLMVKELTRLLLNLCTLVSWYGLWSLASFCQSLRRLVRKEYGRPISFLKVQKKAWTDTRNSRSRMNCSRFHCSNPARAWTLGEPR